MKVNKNRFHLHAHLSPTDYNLSLYLKACGWKSTKYRAFASFSDDNLNFEEEAAQCLEYKHRLAKLISAYCPEVMPITYEINDKNWVEKIMFLDEGVWILKPALLNNGQHIKIFSKLSELRKHFLNPHRLSGEHVLQQYLEPHLLRDRRKYSIRQFLIITNYAGAFLYRFGYYNVALHPYQDKDFSDLKSHLTNEHLYGNEPNVLQIPTTEFDSHQLIYPQIRILSAKVIKGLQQEYPEAFVVKKKKILALFGMDFMITNAGEVFLLEANHGPCFPTANEHPLQLHLYKNFWRAIVNGFVLPIANKSIEEPDLSVFDAL